MLGVGVELLQAGQANGVIVMIHNGDGTAGSAASGMLEALAEGLQAWSSRHVRISNDNGSMILNFMVTHFRELGFLLNLL